MVKSYFLLYKKAKELYDEGKVQLDNIKSENDADTYYFSVNSHNVRLDTTRIVDKRLWLRHWRCDCQHYSLWQDKSECKHIKAAEYYLINGGYKNVK